MHPEQQQQQQHQVTSKIRGTLSPLHAGNEDDVSRDSNSLWEGELHNGSLLDSADSQDDGDCLDYTRNKNNNNDNTKNRRSVSQKANVTYKNGEFQIISGSSIQGSKGECSRDRSRGSKNSKSSKNGSKQRKKKRDNNGESTTILEIMLNVGHDLLVGTKTDEKNNGRKGRNSRRRNRGRSSRDDPATKIVDGFVSIIFVEAFFFFPSPQAALLTYLIFFFWGGNLQKGFFNCGGEDDDDFYY